MPLAFAAEIAIATLGGALKRKESLSARLGDVLSELYLLSAVLKRHADDGAPVEDRPLIEWCCETGFCRIEAALDGFIRNFPVRPLAWLLRAVTLPWGVKRRGAADRTTHRSAELLMTPGATRDRLTPGVYLGPSHEGLGGVEHAFVLVHDVSALKRKAREAGHGNDWPGAVVAGVLTPGEAARLAEADAAVRAAIAVDDFAPHELSAVAPVRAGAPAGGAFDRQSAPEKEQPAWITESV